MIVGAAMMVSEKFCVALRLTLSATWTVKLYPPAVVGTPLITPPGLSDRPAGSGPLVTVQVYGGVPPDAVTLFE